MKKITFAWLLLSVLVTAFSSVVAQTPIIKYFPGVGVRGGGIYSVEQLPQGGYIGVGNVDMVTYNEFWIWRMNEQGDTLWTKQYYPNMANSNRWAVRSVVTSDGGLLILTGTYVGPYYASYEFNSVMKTNAQGDSIWSVIISSTDTWANARLNDLVATPDGGCIVAGASSYGGNPRVVKVSSTGTISWETFIPAVIYTTFNSVCLTSDGEYIATGVNHNNMTALNNLLVAKFSSTGATLWSKTFYSGLFNTGDSIKAEGLSVASTPDGGCMLSGYVTDPGMWGASALLMRLNASGDALWTKKYFRWANRDPFQMAKAYRIVQLPSEQYLIFLHTYAGSTAAGAVLLKVNASGDSLWSQVGYDYRIMMRGIDNEGGILFCGYARGPAWDNVAVFIRTTSGGIYISPALSTPWQNQTNVSLNPDFTWDVNGSPHIITSFQFNLSSDSAFTNIVLDTSVTTNTLHVTGLLPNTKYFWRVRTFGSEGSPSLWSNVYGFTTQIGTSVETIDDEVPLSFSLQQNYPNPFNPTTNIDFAIPSSNIVRISVVDLLGREVATLVDTKLPAGRYKTTWNAAGAASGIYFYQLRAGDFVQSKKLILLR